MKHILLVLILGVCMTSAVQAQETLEVKTSAVCEMCKEAIEYDLTFAKGIKFVELDLENKVVTVKYNGKKTSADEVRQQITKVGYHADWMERDSVAYENLPLCCKDGSHDTPIPQVPTPRKGS
ncbi:MAG: mercuric ion binding protein [Cyclobacteriaceae bacterium]|jgi:mercuric ion binding protein